MCLCGYQTLHFLPSCVFYVFFLSFSYRSESETCPCVSPTTPCTNETVGKEQSITSLCPNPCLDRRLHQFYRPFPPLLAKGLFRKSCFWQLCATPYKQVSWARTSFSASLQQIWKAKRFLMLNLWKLNEKKTFASGLQKSEDRFPEGYAIFFWVCLRSSDAPPAPRPRSSPVKAGCPPEPPVVFSRTTTVKWLCVDTRLTQWYVQTIHSKNCSDLFWRRKASSASLNFWPNMKNFRGHKSFSEFFWELTHINCLFVCVCMTTRAFFKVCLVLIFLNTICEKTYPEPWNCSFVSISWSKSPV